MMMYFRFLNPDLKEEIPAIKFDGNKYENINEEEDEYSKTIIKFLMNFPSRTIKNIKIEVGKDKFLIYSVKVFPY